MGKTQYDVGKSWEDKIIDYYNSKDYYVYKIPTLVGGTVFDIIAIHKGAVLCIECKHIKGDKLYFEGSGLKKKKDEIDHFINASKTNLYLYVYSDKKGIFWISWPDAREKLINRGYLKTSDMIPAVLEPVEVKKNGRKKQQPCNLRCN